MPELRHDALTGRLVLLAPARAARPHTVEDRPPAATATVAACPFCAGHESETPPEVARVGPGAPDTAGWQVRVVPNLYPIVGGPDAGAGATGAHEVIVLSPDHAADFGALSDEQAGAVLLTMRDRSRVHADAGRAYVQLLLNHGRAAGASIAHPHAQLLALDFVPPLVSGAVGRFAEAPGDLVLASNADAVERGLGVASRDGALAWCPHASVAAFEVRVASPTGGPRFATTDDDDVAAVARVLRDVLARVATVLGSPPYNVVLHDGPTNRETPYHWWLEVVPRVGVVAGFEIGTGVLVNTVDPADAAAQLRGDGG